jgi:hypothetical protein
MVDEIPKYMDIVQSILRNPKLEVIFLKSVVPSLLQNNEALTLDISIINTIIACPDIDLYDRYLIYLKYILYNVYIPPDKIGAVMARRLFLLGSDIHRDEIEEEIGIVEVTLDSVIDSVSSYKSVIRVNFPSVPIATPTGTKGYFMFYVHSMPTIHTAYVGNVSIDNKEYKVIVNCEYLHGVDDFKSHHLIRLDSFDYSNHVEYSKIYDFSAQKLKDKNNQYTYQSIALILREDTRFRQWLLSHHLLSEFEQSMLPERQCICDLLFDFIRVNKQSREYVVGFDDDFDFEDEDEMYGRYMSLLEDGQTLPEMFESNRLLKERTDVLRDTLDVELKDRVSKLCTLEAEFYSSQEGRQLETARTTLRNDFYASKLHQGLIIVCNVYKVTAVREDEIIITINPHLSARFTKLEKELMLYHTIQPLQFTDDYLNLPNQNILASYTSTSSNKTIHFESEYDLQMTSNPDSDSDYRTVSLVDPTSNKPICVDTPFQYVSIGGIFNNNIIYQYRGTIYIVDPSLLPDIDEVINNSYPESNADVDILAYPYFDPTFFVRLHTHNGKHESIRSIINKKGKVEIIPFYADNQE